MSIFEAYATVIINVLDVNDECPTLPATMSIKYRGNPDVGDVIGTVRAMDVDSTTRYSMTTSDLTVNSTTGAISTTQSFTYSFTKTATYTVTASDSGNNCPSVSTSVTLDLETCTNPEDYQFQQSKYVRTYREDKTLGPIFTVSIRKVALNPIYSIVYTGSTVQRYTINANTGMITLTQSLDYETAKEEHFQVKATFPDGVRSYAEVTIFVTDVNDECPQFASASTTVYITEPARAGTYVTKAEITDVDTSSVNTHSFSMTGDNAFQIDSSNGVVTLKSYYETSRKQSTYQHNMTITVTDAGCTSRTHQLTVIVYKVLIQEYIFNQPMYKYEISEDQTVPHMIDCFKNLFNHTGVYRLKFTNSTCFSLSSTGKSTAASMELFTIFYIIRYTFT